ncbi:MAG: T9SS type A sorting domain-containing protein, partial [Bacteroidota bacterium]|nr:T9SS type A sorting domain-containing protein [Bacteroidota bacterium]
GADAPDNNTKLLSPHILGGKQSGSVQWMVEHPPTPVDKLYFIEVWVKTANADSTVCRTMIVIPALTVPFRIRVDADGPLSFCEADSVTLEAPVGYASYQWSTGDSTRALVVRTSGSYFCTVRTADGKFGRSDTLQVAVHRLPAKPVIGRSGDVLATGTAHAYQWLRDGQDIPGATQQFHIAVHTGSYRVRVTNEFGCENISDAFPVSVLGVENAEVPETPRIDVYPDPAHDAVTVVVDLPRAGRADIWLVDALGRSERLRVPSGSEQLKTTIDLSGRARGLYHILVLSGEEIQTRKFMVY